MQLNSQFDMGGFYEEVFSISNCIISCNVFCACQANPSKDIVTSKNDGGFERSIMQQSTQNKSTNDFQFTKNDQFLSTDESVTFTWNINQPINMRSMPVLEADPHFFTGSDVEHIAKALFGENANFFDLGQVTKRQLSKTQIQEKIQTLSQYVSEDALRELMGDEANVENVKFWLEHYTVAYETAPEKPSYKRCDWSLKPLQYYEDSGSSWDSKSKGLFATTTVNGYNYLIRAYVHNDSDYTRNEIFITLGDGDDPTYVQKTADIAKLCCTDEPTETQITSAKSKAQNMLSNMGLCDYVLADVFVEKQFIGEKPAYQIREPLNNSLQFILLRLSTQNVKIIYRIRTKIADISLIFCLFSLKRAESPYIKLRKVFAQLWQGNTDWHKRTSHTAGFRFSSAPDMPFSCSQTGI